MCSSFSRPQKIYLYKIFIMNLAENIIAFHHYSLKIKDFDSTLKFYKALGFDEIHLWELQSFNLKKGMMFYNQKINCYIELFDEEA